MTQIVSNEWLSDTQVNMRIAELQGWTNVGTGWSSFIPVGAYICGNSPEDGKWQPTPWYTHDWVAAGPLFDDMVDAFGVAEAGLRVNDHALEGRGEFKRPHCEMIARAWLASPEAQHAK